MYKRQWPSSTPHTVGGAQRHNGYVKKRVNSSGAGATGAHNARTPTSPPPICREDFRMHRTHMHEARSLHSCSWLFFAHDGDVTAARPRQWAKRKECERMVKMVKRIAGADNETRVGSAGECRTMCER